MEERDSDLCAAEERLGRKQTLHTLLGSNGQSLTLDYPHAYALLPHLWVEGDYFSLVLLLTEELI